MNSSKGNDCVAGRARVYEPFCILSCSSAVVAIVLSCALKGCNCLSSVTEKFYLYIANDFDVLYAPLDLVVL